MSSTLEEVSRWGGARGLPCEKPVGQPGRDDVKRAVKHSDLIFSESWGWAGMAWRLGSLQQREEVWPAAHAPLKSHGAFINCVHISSWHVLCNSLSDVALRFPEPVLPEALGMDISPGNGNRGRGYTPWVPCSPAGDSSEDDPHCLESIPV